MSEDAVHVPVLLDEVMRLLDIRPGQRVVDATVDGGGHASAILDRLGGGGMLLGIDRDPALLAVAERRLAGAVAAGRAVLAAGNLRNLAEIAAAHGMGRVNAVLFDLGVSSFHIDRGGRGFSYSRDEPLDLRFDPSETDTRPAAELLAHASFPELAGIIREYGEERFASRIARRIVAVREKTPIATSTQLLDLITQVLPGRERAWAGRSAARVFQALRIAVNDEIEAIREALPQALDLLVPGGRVAVIAFHSVEDRIVKHLFLEARRAGRVAVITKRPVRPSDAEISANPRASSAKLRVAERMP